MATPAPKTKEMKDFLDGFTNATVGRSRTESIK